MGTFGYILPPVFAENEELLYEIGWKPYHVDEGFDADASTVSVCGTAKWGYQMYPTTSDPERLAQLLAYDVARAGSPNHSAMHQDSPRLVFTVFMTPSVAKTFAEAGYSREEVQNAVWKHARYSLTEVDFESYYGAHEGQRETHRGYLKSGKLTERHIEKGKLPTWFPTVAEGEDATIPVVPKAEQLPILVCGDPTRYQAHTLKDRSDLLEKLKGLNQKSWPEFIKHGDTYSWQKLYDEFRDFLLMLTDQDDSLIGGGFTVPVSWNGTHDGLPTSIEEIITNGIKTKNESANTLVAIAALVDDSCRGQQLSAEILKQMKYLTIRHGLQNLIVPVRPTWKARYPLQGIESYATWLREDGLLYDPWLRTHQRLGANVLKCVDSTLKVEGTVEDWKQWTGLVFPESGHYIVKGALQPVRIDIESNMGVYHDPNVWVQHPIP
jgi:hypothetical protein